MVKSSETQIGRSEVDTRCEGVQEGQQVRIITGPLAGLEGVIVERRVRGRLLIHVATGVYIEVQQTCVVKDD